MHRMEPEWQELSVRLAALVIRRATALWEEDGRPEQGNADRLRRARREVEREFRRRIAKAGTYPRRWNPPLEIQEALTPGLSRQPGGLKWSRGPDGRG